MQDRTGKDGRIGSNPLASLIKWTGLYQEPWVRALEGGEFGAANGQEMVTLFQYLEFCLTQVVMDNELGALQARLPSPTQTAHVGIGKSAVSASLWRRMIHRHAVPCAVFSVESGWRSLMYLGVD